MEDGIERDLECRDVVTSIIFVDDEFLDTFEPSSTAIVTIVSGFLITLASCKLPPGTLRKELQECWRVLVFHLLQTGGVARLDWIDPAPLDSFCHMVSPHL